MHHGTLSSFAPFALLNSLLPTTHCSLEHFALCNTLLPPFAPDNHLLHKTPCSSAQYFETQTYKPNPNLNIIYERPPFIFHYASCDASLNMANDCNFSTSHDIRLYIANLKVSMVPVLALHKLLLISKVGVRVLFFIIYIMV